MINSPSGVENQSSEEIIVYNVRRYGTAGRFYHWIHAACMMLFISTGWQIYVAKPIFGSMTIVRALHIALGIFIIFWDLVVQIAIIALEGHVHDVIPTPNDLADLILILLCTLRIIDDSHYPHYDFYDPTMGIYVRKYHPAQKFLSIADILAMAAMGITGITLAETIQPGSAGVMGFVTGFNVLYSWLIPITLENLLFIHFMLFMYFLLTTIFHIYFALIPQNFSRLRAMITGNEQIRE